MLPAPKLMPPLAAWPGRTSSVLAPMLSIVFWMAVEEPWPISTMVITAAMPMTMPSVVSAARMMLRRQGLGGRPEGMLVLHAEPPFPVPAPIAGGGRGGGSGSVAADDAVADADDALRVRRHARVVRDQEDRDALLAVQLLEHAQDLLAASASRGCRSARRRGGTAGG